MQKEKKQIMKILTLEMDGVSRECALLEEHEDHITISFPDKIGEQLLNKTITFTLE